MRVHCLAATMAAVVAVMTACGDASAPAPDDGPDVVTVARGNGQVSAPGTELPAPITVKVVSPRGRPRRGVAVDWSIGDQGSLTSTELVTDDSGFARTTWLLAPRAGRYSGLARVDARGVPFHATAATPMPLGIVQRVTFTPPMFGEFVHPDVARVPRGWGPARRFLAITPYPGGDVREELPSIYASGELAEWEVPDGLTNPVGQRPSNGYLSDPDVVFEPDQRALYLYFRQVVKDNAILLTTSSDGTTWSAPVTVTRAPNHMLVSPAVVRVAAGDWHMWSVNAGTAGCTSASTTVEHRISTDGLHWSGPRPVTFAGETPSAWHIDVIWVPEHGEYWALFNGKPSGSCSTPALYIARSADGDHWESNPTAVLSRGAIPEFADIVYRASLEYEAHSDVVTLWYSGARYGFDSYVWSAAVERRQRADLFESSRTAGLMRRSRVAPSSAPPLLRAP